MGHRDHVTKHVESRRESRLVQIKLVSDYRSLILVNLIISQTQSSFIESGLLFNLSQLT